MGSQFTLNLSSMNILVVLLLSGLACAQYDGRLMSIEEFDKENNIVDLDDDLKAEEAKRLAEVEAEIIEDNEKYAKGEASSGMKLYPWSDKSKEEIEAEKMGLSREWDPSRGDAPPERAMGLIMPPESERINSPQEELDSLYETDRGYAPRTYFAVNDGLVTIAKNQGNCGSCAAFAASGLHETCMAKAGAPTAKLDLSEQYLIDCGFNKGSMNACWGAWPTAYTDWFVNDRGVSPHEGSYPYLGKYPNFNCKKANRVRKWNSGAKVVKSIKEFQCNEAKLKKMIYEHGAVLIGVATNDAFYDYDGNGIFNECISGMKTGHAVLAVGYGEERGQKYWLIKNSWGKNWGLNGHIKLLRGSNHCNVEELCISASCVANGRQEIAPTTPAPPPIPVNFWCDLSGLYPGRKLNGYYTLRIRGPDGGLIESSVRCKGTKCTPAKAGPSNACMYICGKVKC